MACYIKPCKDGNVLILCCDGELVSDGARFSLRKAINDQLDQGNCNLLIELTPSMPCQNKVASEIIAGINRADEVCGSVKLCNVPKTFETYLARTMLDVVIEVYPTVTAAKEAFKGPSRYAIARANQAQKDQVPQAHL